MISFIRRIWGSKKREEALVDIIELILDSTRDGVIDKEEFYELRKRAYDILIDFGYDKRKRQNG